MYQIICRSDPGNVHCQMLICSELKQYILCTLQMFTLRAKPLSLQPLWPIKQSRRRCRYLRLHRPVHHGRLRCGVPVSVRRLGARRHLGLLGFGLSRLRGTLNVLPVPLVGLRSDTQEASENPQSGRDGTVTRTEVIRRRGWLVCFPERKKGYSYEQ